MLGALALSGCTFALDYDRAQLSRADVAVPDTLSDAAAEASADLGTLCPGGRADCDGNASNGCETDLTSDLRHCGLCGRACLGSMMCNAGACSSRACVAPMVACGMQCTDLQTDARHCGNCETNCGPDANRCCQGVCMARCI